MDDREIIEELKVGNRETFKLIMKMYQKMVLNCSYKFLRNKESAEDITQEVFIEVFESINSFRADSKLSTWIYRITVTKSLNHLKSLKRKKRFGIITSFFKENGEVKEIPSNDTLDAEKVLENNDQATILSLALEKIPENQRIAFTLSKLNDMSYQEISNVLNTSISAVESLIHRAKSNLRKILYNYYKKHL